MGNCLGKKPSTARSASGTFQPANITSAPQSPGFATSPVQLLHQNSINSESALNTSKLANNGTMIVYPHEPKVTSSTKSGKTSASSTITSHSTNNSHNNNHGSGNLFIALFDYTARTSEDLSFKKNELLEVLNDMQGEFGCLGEVKIGGFYVILNWFKYD